MFRINLQDVPVGSPRALLAGTILLIAAAGCSSKNVTGPAKPVPLTIYAMGVGAANPTGSPSAALSSGTSFRAAAAEDPLPVTFTRALLVVRDVRFKLTDDGPADSTDDGFDDNDSTGTHEDDDDDEGDGMAIFRGPFVIDLLAQSAESLDTQMVLPGDYRRVQGHLRSLRSSDWNASSFDFLIGSTVYLAGTVDGEGGGPFTYQTRIDNEFMIRGNFTVQAETPATAFIVFDVSRWLRGRDGTLLDPRILENDTAIQWAIRHAIKVGMDDDHDGDCDDDMHAAGD
jgi:hypothetical protein